MFKEPAYTVKFPAAQWLFVQAWLVQNYLMPLTDYAVYPGFPLCTVGFYRESDYCHFTQRWADIIDSNGQNPPDPY